MSSLDQLRNPQPESLYEEESNMSKLRGCESEVQMSPRFQCSFPQKCFLFLFDDWKREAYEQIWDADEKMMRRLEDQKRIQK